MKTGYIWESFPCQSLFNRQIRQFDRKVPQKLIGLLILPSGGEPLQYPGQVKGRVSDGQLPAAAVKGRQQRLAIGRVPEIVRVP